MKKTIVQLLLVTVVFSGCETLQSGGKARSDSAISPLQTFRVTPPDIGSVIFGVDTREQLIQQTVDDISKQLVKKGYRTASASETPDFILNPVWIVTTQNNPEYQLNAGSVDTATQIPQLIRVVTLEVYAVDGSSGQSLWKGGSPWPFSRMVATPADIENAAVWAMENFPTQQAKLNSAAE